MQWINLLPEDAGIQNLKADNRRPVIARDVDAISPYPSAHAVRIGKGAQRDPGKHQDRRADDRREGNDRRKQQVPVMLDTRATHDRRGISNRRAAPATNANSGQPPLSTHLSLYA
ncbi:hypothetical protein MNBD_GAMMA15-995 [hydrothermal vent metagenome]|uniref:Uncharacterized protein n=1 Tax=hydrothermal vent metagenome TaxID=652676 RepID=A0A3B0YU28_9ZZZZ